MYAVSVCMKTVRIANAGKHALESHVRSAQHQRCERAASSSVGNVLAPQSRVAIPSTSSSTSGDSSCETGTFSTGKFANSKTGGEYWYSKPCFLIFFYFISELVLY